MGVTNLDQFISPANEKSIVTSCESGFRRSFPILCRILCNCDVL